MYPHLYIVLPTYGVLAFVGGFVAVVLTFYRTNKYKMEFSDFMKAFVFCMIGGFIGSRVLFVLTKIPELMGDFSFYNVGKIIVQGGFVYYGGLFGALLGILIYTNHGKKYVVPHIYNMIAPAIPLFHGFGRIGCFFAGCCYGKELEPPIVFWEVLRLKRVPIQMFEALFEFILCFIILIWEKKKCSCNLLKVYLVSYGIFRFVIEFFRGDEVRGIFFGLSTSQWISVIVLLCFGCSDIRKKVCLNGKWRNYYEE